MDGGQEVARGKFVAAKFRIIKARMFTRYLSIYTNQYTGFGILFFCSSPLVQRAMVNRMRAGMERQK